MTKIRLMTASAFDYLDFDQNDIDELYTLREEKGGWWERSFEFVNGLKDRDKRELTPKMIKWANDIHDELDTIRRKR